MNAVADVPGRHASNALEQNRMPFRNGCRVKWTGDSAIVAPPLIAERRHADETVGCVRRTLEDT